MSLVAPKIPNWNSSVKEKMKIFGSAPNQLMENAGEISKLSAARPLHLDLSVRGSHAAFRFVSIYPRKFKTPAAFETNVGEQMRIFYPFEDTQNKQVFEKTMKKFYKKI